MHVPAAAAAAAAGGAGLWLFDYNRENFQYDQEMRFQRFTAARGFMNAQVSQYRQDIHGICEMTMAKMDAWQVTLTLFMCVCAALSCAGRLGMHGAAPPGWFCALYSGNIFTSIMYCGLALWLSMHGSLRAQCAMVSLLTRKVRLPIPSVAQLDQARNFGSAYEKQQAGDILRVPFMFHPQAAPEALPAADKGAGGKKTKGEAEFLSTNRASVPSWIRDEQVIDKGEGMVSGAVQSGIEADTTPDHFKLLSEVQDHWWQYDVYARISMLYGVCHFLYAVSYYCIGTAMSELRGFWIAWSLPLCFLAAQALILRLDVFGSRGQSYLPNAEWIGHFAPYLAIAACALEYRPYYSENSVKVTWVLVILAFLGHFIMQLRFLDLACPNFSTDRDMPDEPGKQWWSNRWWVPQGYTRALWLLAPPKKLEPEQDDLLHEMADLKDSGGGVTTCRRRNKGEPKPAAMSNPRVLRSKLISMHQMLEEAASRVRPEDEKTFRDLQSEYDKLRNQVSKLADEDQREEHVSKIAGQVTSTMSDLKQFHSTLVSKEGTATTSTRSFWYTGDNHAPDLPWQLTRFAVLTAAFVWLFMMVVSAVEMHMGPESLVAPPGEPPWIRNQKWRHAREGQIHLSTGTLPSDYRLHAASTAHYYESTHAEGGHGDDHGAHAPASGGHGDDHPAPAPAGGGHDDDHPAPAPAHGEHHDDEHAAGGHGGDPHHRRLAGVLSLAAAGGNRSDMARAALEDLLKVLPSISEVMDRADAVHDGPGASTAGPPASRPAGSFMAPGLRTVGVSWPQMFEPRFLLCEPRRAGGNTVVALTPRGFGALAQVDGGSGRAGAPGVAEARPFSLEGLGAFGPLAGAAWASDGLKFMTRAGNLVDCPGHVPSGGAWRCLAAKDAPLPLPAGAQIRAAAIADHAGDVGSRVVAAVLEHMPSVLALFKSEGGLGGWSPAGEVRVPPGDSHRIGLSFAGDELLITMGDGQVHQRHIFAGSSSVHPAPAGAALREFHSACMHPSTGNLMRLALNGNGAGMAWRPELLMAA